MERGEREVEEGRCQFRLGSVGWGSGEVILRGLGSEVSVTEGENWAKKRRHERGVERC